MSRIALDLGVTGTIEVELRRELTPTVRALLASLPFSSSAHRWGNEVYFETPFHADLEGDARQWFEVGEVAFWPEGDALAVFFGRTPASTDDRPRPYSPCNVVGRVVGPAGALSSVGEGDTVQASRI